MNRGWGTIAILASGPSLTVEQCALVRQAQQRGACRVIAINNCYLLAPDADALYAADGAWWRVHIDAVRHDFRGELWTQDRKHATEYGLNYVESIPGAGIGPIDGPLRHGSNSGHQAIGLARKFGARRIILCGFDMQRTGGLAHWHGQHPHPLSDGDPRGWIKHFITLAPQLVAEGIACVNCTTTTALECFPRADLAETLGAL